MGVTTTQLSVSSYAGVFTATGITKIMDFGTTVVDGDAVISTLGTGTMATGAVTVYTDLSIQCNTTSVATNGDIAVGSTGISEITI